MDARRVAYRTANGKGLLDIRQAGVQIPAPALIHIDLRHRQQLPGFWDAARKRFRLANDLGYRNRIRKGWEVKGGVGKLTTGRQNACRQEQTDEY